MIIQINLTKIIYIKKFNIHPPHWIFLLSIIFSYYLMFNYLILQSLIILFLLSSRGGDRFSKTIYLKINVVYPHMVSGIQMTQEDFLARARAIHGEQYDYSQTFYINSRSLVAIGCRKCCQTFHQIARNHLKYGCNKCPKPGPTMSQETFLLRARAIHGDKFDYTHSVYVNSRTKVAIGCRKCGKTFHIIPKSHMICGCNKCSDRARLSQEEFILKAKNVHGERYSYDETIYRNNNKSKIEIGCRESGHGTFRQTPHSHLRGNGCPKCKNKTEILCSKH